MAGYVALRPGAQASYFSIWFLSGSPEAQGVPLNDEIESCSHIFQKAAVSLRPQPVLLRECALRSTRRVKPKTQTKTT